jgi:hypothetical protein
MPAFGAVTSANALVPDIVAELTAASGGSPATSIGPAGNSVFEVARTSRCDALSGRTEIEVDPQLEIARTAAQIETIDAARLAWRMVLHES